MPSTLDGGLDDLLSANLAIVTGKGGVGKTTVAAALALAAVDAGRRTLLVEVEGRQSLPRVFETGKWDYTEREFRPNLWGAALEPADAVYEYLEMFYGIKRVQWLMERSNAVEFVTTAAPGLRDLLLIGKIYEIESRKREDGRRMYDLIILDAPPTGRIVPFLEAPEAVTDIVRVGQIKRQSAQIEEMLTNPDRTTTIVTTLLEEMPVREAVEAIAALEQAGIGCGPIVANQVTVPRLTRQDLDQLRGLGPEGLADRAAKGGVELAAGAAELGIEAAAAHRDRVELEERLRAEVRERSGRPVLDLPLLTGSRFDTDALEILADLVAVQTGGDGPRAREVPGFRQFVRSSGTEVARS